MLYDAAMATDTSESRIIEPGYAVWHNDFMKAADAVLPFVEEDAEGNKFISMECPFPLRQVYSDLAGIGFYYGYLRV